MQVQEKVFVVSVEELRQLSISPFFSPFCVCILPATGIWVWLTDTQGALTEIHVYSFKVLMSEEISRILLSSKFAK